MELSVENELLLYSYLSTVGFIYLNLFVFILFYPENLYLLMNNNIEDNYMYNYLDIITIKTNEITFIYMFFYIIMKLFVGSLTILNYLSKLESGVYSDLLTYKSIKYSKELLTDYNFIDSISDSSCSDSDSSIKLDTNKKSNIFTLHSYYEDISEDESSSASDSDIYTKEELAFYINRLE